MESEPEFTLDGKRVEHPLEHLLKASGWQSEQGRGSMRLFVVLIHREPLPRQGGHRFPLLIADRFSGFGVFFSRGVGFGRALTASPSLGYIAAPHVGHSNSATRGVADEAIAICPRNCRRCSLDGHERCRQNLAADPLLGCQCTAPSNELQATGLVSEVSISATVFHLIIT